MKVLYFGTYDQNYLHNRLMLAALQSAGIQVAECHVQLWRDTDDKVKAARQKNWLALGARILQAYVEVLRAYLPLHRSYDLMLLGYTGQFDVFLARVLCWLSGRPLVLDVLMSVYLIATERQLPARNILRWIENISCRLPDSLILDTPEYAEWFEQTYGIDHRSFHLVPLGADDRLFKPLSPRQPDRTFRVLYYGTFIPLHGVEYIVQAAYRLSDHSEICFRLIGQGPERAKAERLTNELRLTNVTFADWVPLEELPSQAAQADVLLGVFGTTEQSMRTVQNKIYQGLAMSKPVITGDTPAIRAAMNHRQHIYLIERANPVALADAILELQANPTLRQSIAAEGHRLFQARYTIEAIGRQLKDYFEQVLKTKTGHELE